MGGVGRWRSAAGRARFVDAYRAGLATLPAVDESFDVPTTFGTVRVYRFDGPVTGRPVVLLPGRSASTPMWAANLPGLQRHRTVYSVDLLGEPGLSVQRRPISDADDQAQWFDETLTGLGLGTVHLLGVSFGGWSAVNHALHRPGRAVSLTLLDPVLTFAPLPAVTVLATVPMVVPGMPWAVRRRVLRWIGGGNEVDDSAAEVAVIDAGATGFVLRQPAPHRFSDDELRALDVPVLALIAGRSVIHDGRRAAEQARKLLRHGQVELWESASHAMTGEFPAEIAGRAGEFWNAIDGQPPTAAI